MERKNQTPEQMTILQMQKCKKDLGLTNEKIAELSGVPLGTVQKVFSGTTRAPRWETRAALERVFLSESASASDCVREPEPAYGKDPRQGSFTLEDYLAIPDDRRVELIDGFIYDMASALPVHQAILGELYYQLYLCVENHPECELFLSPSDVRLDEDNRTVVQPDLYIFCNRKNPDNRMISGAPDFIIEILSPSNRFHDMFRKLNKYRFSHVREYWIVDPEKQKVTVYDLEHDEPPVVYDFQDTKIPLGISGGECAVDFGRIYEKVKRYL